MKPARVSDSQLLDWQEANDAEVRKIGSRWVCQGHAEREEPLIVTAHGEGRTNRDAIRAAMHSEGR